MEDLRVRIDSVGAEINLVEEKLNDQTKSLHTQLIQLNNPDICPTHSSSISSKYPSIQGDENDFSCAHTSSERTGGAGL
jgi:hypothetical protein